MPCPGRVADIHHPTEFIGCYYAVWLVLADTPERPYPSDNVVCLVLVGEMPSVEAFDH